MSMAIERAQSVKCLLVRYEDLSKDIQYLGKSQGSDMSH